MRGVLGHERANARPVSKGHRPVKTPAAIVTDSAGEACPPLAKQFSKLSFDA